MFGRMAQAASSALKKTFTVVVEGNIGSGKTTFLNHFRQYDNVCILAEPVEMWRNCCNHNLLSYMYEDRERWGFTFQSYVQLTMLQQHMYDTQHPVKLMERSIFSARYCFVEKMFQDGVMPAPSKSVLHEWFKWLISGGLVTADLIVYLRTTPEVVYKRMLERNRKEEVAIPLEYLQDLHQLHEDWLFHKTSFPCPAPVITLDANLDKATILEEYEKHEPLILNKVAVGVRS